MPRVSGLQPVWDLSIIDREKTTANFEVGTPVKKERVFTPDKPWEERSAHYGNVIKDGDTYRMYYLSHLKMASALVQNEKRKDTVEVLDSYVCYAESKDGIHWEKPSLGLYEYEGSKENNILLRSSDKPETNGFFDNFFAFKDENPACPPEKKYKATAYMRHYRLGGYSSPDGIHWNYECTFDMPGKFDTLNVCWWDKKIKKYVAYVRDFHNIPEDGDLNRGIRDARRTESEDFIHWTTPELITFNETDDYPIYTNNVSRYYRNPDIYIGFPTRYEERQAWNDSFEELCGKELRHKAMAICPRFGLTVTDCIFMSSRDGVHFDKCDEALFTPGYEFAPNWIYGNCYPTYFMWETPVGDGENKELSMLVAHLYAHANTVHTDVLERYTLRIDGFACYRAKFSGNKVVTKPFIFEGNEMRINFSTSAKGSIYITIRDEEGNEAKTCELFGDKIDRRVRFEGAELSSFAGKPVTLEFDMKDAKLYAFEFI